MTKARPEAAIRLRGVRHNNLKNFDLDLPVGKLIVITGLSGSGKSSLAFDTLFAEGQRRYIETFSPYARQFFDRMDKPQVDRIEGIPPAIAIEQRNSVRSTRSTVGTMTELCDYMKLLWPHLARLHCKQCGQPVRKEPPQFVWETLNAKSETRNAEVLITFDLPLSEKLSPADSLALVARQGYQRLLVDGQAVRVEEAALLLGRRAARSTLTVIQDRVKLAPANRARFVEACEQAYHFGKGRLTARIVEAAPAQKTTIQRFSDSTLPFSAGFHCAPCDLDYREPTPALFSFNHPVGACPACKGFGRIIRIDYDLAIPDRSKTLAGGAVKPWQTGMSADCQRDLAKVCKAMDIPMDVPFEKLPETTQEFVINGDPDYGKDDEHEWPRVWYGVKGYFRWLESKAYKMHVRVLLSRYRAYSACPDCQGRRLQPEALLYRIPKGGGTAPLTLADFYALSVESALALFEQLTAGRAAKPGDPLALALNEVRSRLRYLVEVGLGYLTLDRPTRTLSGGETERVNLTTCLGTRLVNTLFVLDEPSVGLHARDTARLVRILQNLRDAGNTVVVVEHEASVMRAADQIVDLGPGSGEKGGEVVYQGAFADLLKHGRSLTGQYLSGRKQIEIPPRRPVRTNVGRLASTSELMALNEAPVPYRASFPLTPALSRGEREKGTPSPEESTPSGLPAVHKKPGGRNTLPPFHEPERGSPEPQRVPGAVAAAALKSRAPQAHGEGERNVHLPDGIDLQPAPTLRIVNASRHNLKNLTVEIPLGRFVALTGVSGSGKTTLVREVLLPALQGRLKSEISNPAKASDRMDSEEGDDTDTASTLHASRFTLHGAERLGQVVLVDQSALGKTPRSNPAVYIGAFEHLRELFAQTDLAKQRGYKASAFSFNSGVGQCERCRGAGFEKIEMQFLSDVFIRCPECGGRRYRGHILEVTVRAGGRDWSIADLLEATVDDGLQFLHHLIHLTSAQRATASIRLLQDVGLGYLRLGQPINTLSGGESQRLKLVSHLAESQSRAGVPPAPVGQADGRTMLARARSRGGRDARPTLATMPRGTDRGVESLPSESKHTLFLFDEPTTGLHFDDVRVLLAVFQRLVEAGHSLVVIEHNLDVIRSADWVIDLGPDAGERGGRLVACGTPEDIAACASSHTGAALRDESAARATER